MGNSPRVRIGEARPAVDAEGGMASVAHGIPPVWDAESRILLLGTMPSPASRAAGFFYMHPRNRFWRVLPAVFGETLALANDAGDRAAAIAERRDFLLRRRIALWDVLRRCDIRGAADATIRNAEPNDFAPLLAHSKVRRVYCTGTAAFALWRRLCADEYEGRFNLESSCLPSTSPANAAWSEGRLAEAYRVLREEG